ncbi:MAG TPA: hypothetical protein VFI28_04350 [Candidatus Limnocylindrales bacterium]|nr:hypothetical protein [Candidatus Limnocylindrales bacterium]
MPRGADTRDDIRSIPATSPDRSPGRRVREILSDIGYHPVAAGQEA